VLHSIREENTRLPAGGFSQWRVITYPVGGVCGPLPASAWACIRTRVPQKVDVCGGSQHGNGTRNCRMRLRMILHCRKSSSQLYPPGRPSWISNGRWGTRSSQEVPNGVSQPRMEPSHHQNGAQPRRSG
jgi:hypothetical protein